MDPDVTLAIMTDRDETLETRIEAAENLTTWIANGGYEPKHYTMVLKACYERDLQYEAKLHGEQAIMRNVVSS